MPTNNSNNFANPVAVATGGTGDASLTAYAVLCGGTSSTNPVQSVASVGSSTNVLISNGASALPTFQAVTSSGFTTINVQKFTASGTYTPTANMKYAVIECVGSGGGGGGAASVISGGTVGGGGGAGGYSRTYATAASVGASQTVTIGAIGAAGTAGNNPGGNGGDVSVGTLCIAKGGSGGGGGTGGASPLPGIGGAGGVAGTGDFTLTGDPGATTWAGTSSFHACAGSGGSSIFGGGGQAGILSNTGTAGHVYGSGGSGGNAQAAVNRAGFAGSLGIVIVTEYI